MAAKKKAVKKTTKKAVKKTAKKTTKRAAPVAKKVGPAIKTPMRKSEIFSKIAEDTDLTRKQVSAVFDSLAELMNRHLKKRAAGEFTVPGLMKLKVTRKPATKARKGINPFTGEETVFKAKPARNVVKVRPLKKVKEMAES
jgi:nucleoid DNA-binding protein